MRIEEREAEYRRRLAVATFAAVALHLVAALWLDLEWERVQRLDRDRKIDLGYAGERRILSELEVLEPNSIQAYFYQKAREGRSRAVEYRLVQPLPLDPGPEPVPKPQPKPLDEAATEAVEIDESPELVEPVFATHREISFSEDFVILNLVKPLYPEYELARRIRARLLVAVWVTPQGDLENEQIQEATTDPPSAPSRSFEIATLEAIRQWKVRPPKRLEKTTGIWLTIPIQFDPDDDNFIDTDARRSR